jgi:hypothetical protein
MSTTTFIGIGLQLQSVAQTAVATLRVRFTQPPLALSSGGAHDALNPALYTLTGPGGYAISNIGPVYNDSQAFDLFLTAPLAAGLWIISVSTALHAYDGSSIQAQRTGSFMVSAAAPGESVSMGAVNDAVEDLLRKHLNPALKGDAWDAVIAGIATGDQKNRDNAVLAFDQLFKSTASGIYLERRAGDDGVQRPQSIGMSDDLFREYSIETTNSKLVESALLKILKIFYGADSVQAHLDSAAVETYSFQDGDDLSVLIDERVLVKTVFAAADFALAGVAHAVEVAAALNRSFIVNGSTATAAAIVDPVTGSTLVRIYSGALGLGSSVRVVGGKAQTTLQFPTLLPAFSGLPTWTLTTIPATGTLRFSPTSTFDVSQVQIGDYVTVYGAGFTTNNRGTYTVTNTSWAYPGGVLTQYFDVVNSAGTAQNVTQAAATDLMVFRPTRASIHTTPSRAVVVASIGEEVDVVLPATSQAVNRGPKLAAYGQVNPSIALTAVERMNGLVSAATASAHGLSVGSQVQIDGVVAGAAVPPTVTGVYASSLSDYSKGSIWSRTAGAVHAAGAGGIAVRMLDGSVFHGYGYAQTAGTRADTITTWGRLIAQAETVLGDGSKQVTFVDANNGVVAHTANFPAASLGTSVLWSYGQVVITGGEIPGSPRQAYNGVQLFTSDPVTGGSVASLNTLNAARAAHAQVTLTYPGQTFDGGFFVVGGMGALYNRAITSTERYSLADTNGTIPQTYSWKTKGSMNEPRAQHQMVVLPSGKVLVAGGRPLAQGHAVDSDTVACWRLDSAIGTAPDSGPNALTLTDTNTPTTGLGESGNARFYGATSYSGRAANDAVLTTTLHGAYTVQGWFNDNAHAATGTVLSMAVALGGTSATNTQLGFGIAGDNYKVWFHTGSNILTTLTTGSVAATATYTWNHFSLTFDGTASYSLYINGALLHTWTSTAPTGGTSAVWSLGRDPAGVTPAFNGGGVDDVRVSNTAHSALHVYQSYQTSTGELYPADASRIGLVARSCEVYDPVADTWSYTGAMACPRYNHALVVLPNGNVLAVGGTGYDASKPSMTPIALATAEVWNAVTGTWAPAGRMAWARETPSVTYISSKNHLVVTGGSDAVGGARTERFDVTRMTWSIGSATLPQRLVGARSAQLGVDLIGLFGGYDASTNSSGSFMDIYIPNADAFGGTGLNGLFQVLSVPSATTFTYATNEQRYTLGGGGTATPAAAAASTIPGPFVYDEVQGLAVTGQQSTTAGALAAGQRYAVVDVGDATQFPDAEGWLVFAFGYKNQVAPVKYFGRLSSTRLSLDASYKFPQTLPVGTVVTWLSQKGPWVPDAPETVGSFYITASPAGRVAAEAAVAASTAAGVTVKTTVTYPGDRGLGGEGFPSHGNYKLSDEVEVWGSDDLDAEIAAAKVS